MIVVVSGSRTICSPDVVAGAIADSPFEFDEIIHGGARGVDTFAERFAKECQIPTRIFLPDWKKFGKRAGILRNIEMIDQADALIAIWDGQSKGTKQAIDYATKKGLEIYVRTFKRFAKPDKQRIEQRIQDWKAGK